LKKEQSNKGSQAEIIQPLVSENLTKLKQILDPNMATCNRKKLVPETVDKRNSSMDLDSPKLNLQA